MFFSFHNFWQWLTLIPCTVIIDIKLINIIIIAIINVNFIATYVHVINIRYTSLPAASLLAKHHHLIMKKMIKRFILQLASCYKYM